MSKNQVNIQGDRTTVHTWSAATDALQQLFDPITMSEGKANISGNPPGCYLTFSSASLGVLFQQVRLHCPPLQQAHARDCLRVATDVLRPPRAQWSEKPQEFKEEVLAFFKPNKKVPAFKFKSYGGKQEIIRQMQAGMIKRYYIGWTHFLKLAKEWQGELVIYRTSDVELYYLDNGKIIRMEAGKSYDLGKIKTLAFSAVPVKAGTYEGVTTLEFGAFLENANKKGASLGV